MDKKLQIIGLSGTNGSGKDTVGQMLAEHFGYKFISVTDVLREECHRRGLEVKRENLRNISAEWRRVYGLSVLVDRAVEAFEPEKDKYKGLVMASLRNPYEVEKVHELGGSIIWVDADPKVRYQRIANNNRGRAEDQRTYQQFLEDDAAEMYPPEHSDAAVLYMAKVRDQADIFLENNSSSPETLLKDLQTSLKPNR